jgi:hypothetical protein
VAKSTKERISLIESSSRRPANVVHMFWCDLHDFICLAPKVILPCKVCSRTARLAPTKRPQPIFHGNHHLKIGLHQVLHPGNRTLVTWLPSWLGGFDPRHPLHDFSSIINDCKDFGVTVDNHCCSILSGVTRLLASANALRVPKKPSSTHLV